MQLILNMLLHFLDIIIVNDRFHNCFKLLNSIIIFNLRPKNIKDFYFILNLKDIIP